MTNAPERIWADEDGYWSDYNPSMVRVVVGEYIRADLHQSALADRDATIAELQSKLDLMANDPGAQYFIGIAEGQRIYAQMHGPLEIVDSPELASLRDQIARLQARLDAGPTVGQMRMWAYLNPWHDEVTEIANRMEAANDTPDAKGSTDD